MFLRQRCGGNGFQDLLESKARTDTAATTLESGGNVGAHFPKKLYPATLPREKEAVEEEGGRREREEESRGERRPEQSECHSCREEAGTSLRRVAISPQLDSEYRYNDRTVSCEIDLTRLTLLSIVISMGMLKLIKVEE